MGQIAVDREVAQIEANQGQEVEVVVAVAVEAHQFVPAQEVAHHVQDLGNFLSLINLNFILIPFFIEVAPEVKVVRDPEVALPRVAQGKEFT